MAYPPFTWSPYVAIESVTETFKLLTSSSDHLSVLTHSWQSSLTPTRHMRPVHCVTLIQAHACVFDTIKSLIPKRHGITCSQPRVETDSGRSWVCLQVRNLPQILQWQPQTPGRFGYNDKSRLTTLKLGKWSRYLGLCGVINSGITPLRYMPRPVAPVLTWKLKSAKQCGQLSWAQLGSAEQAESNKIAKIARKLD